MKKILIADSNKASLIMTSEIFKDYYPGIQVCSVHTSADAIQIAQDQKNFDIFVIDFDLPDQNGVQTALKIKKISNKPVLLTAFDDKKVRDVLKSKSNKFQDYQNLLKKPVQPEMVRAICGYYYQNNVKTKLTVPCDFIAFLQLMKKSSLCFLVYIVECSINSMQVKIKKNIKIFNRSTMSWMTTKIENIVIAEKVILKCQDPHEIELGQNITEEKVSNLKNTLLMDKFNYQIHGHIATYLSDINHTEQSIWIEFEDIKFSKQIFEAVIREKMHAKFINGILLF